MQFQNRTVIKSLTPDPSRSEAVLFAGGRCYSQKGDVLSPISLAESARLFAKLEGAESHIHDHHSRVAWLKAVADLL